MLYFSRIPLVPSRIVSTSFSDKVDRSSLDFETFNISLVINNIVFKNICFQKTPLQIEATRKLYSFNHNHQNIDKEKLSTSDVPTKLRNELKPSETI